MPRLFHGPIIFIIIRSLLNIILYIKYLNDYKERNTCPENILTSNRKVLGSNPSWFVPLYFLIHNYVRTIIPRLFHGPVICIM